MTRGFLTVLCFLLALSVTVKAQKVALVLSGGGSRGLAHVGVLKALEENHIPIDYIAGTSMGAIIGGLYASGYTLAEIEKFVTSPNFEKWVKGEPDEEYIYYFKNQNNNASWISLKFDVDDLSGKLKTRLPTNIISPYQMDFALLELFGSASAACQYDFDSLFVPFRCVASDIDSNRFVVLKNGQLGNAVRASSTYPFYFKPIQIDGKLLFDGGLYNNFPVDVALKSFHPDVVIGSRTSSNFREPKPNDLLSHIMNMIVNETDYSVPPDKGIMIYTNLPMTTVVDLSLKREFIDSGYVAAQRSMKELMKLIPARVNAAELAERRLEFNNRKPSIIVDSIRILGLSKRQSDYVRKLIVKKTKYMNLSSIRKEYFKLLADDKIDDIFPNLIYAPSRGYYTLEMKIQPAEHFVTEFGGNISSSAANAAYVGLEYRLLRQIGFDFSVNGYFGRFYSSGNLVTRVDFPSSFPYFLAFNYTYNHKDYFRNTTYFFEDKTPTFLLQNENFFGLHFGFPARTKGKVVASVSSGYTLDDYYQDNYFTRTDTADRTRFNFISLNLNYEINSLNYKQLATSGLFLKMSIRYINGEEKTMPGSTSVMQTGDVYQNQQWIQFRSVYDNYFKTVKWLTLGIYGEVFISNMPFFSNYTATILRAPSFSPIPEMNTLFLPKYRSPNYVAGGLKLLFRIVKQFYFRTEAYYFQPYKELVADENLNAMYRKPWSDHSFTGSADLEYHTPFGPVSLSFNYYDRADNNITILFNIGYFIFNKGAFE